MDSNTHGRGEADPPLLTGGLITTNRLLGAGIDYLTLTVPTAGGQVLEACTVHAEPGYAKDGFHRSEVREGMGGRCFRRWDPRQPSNAEGYRYESWLWSGPHAAEGARAARYIDGARPSRVDVAFDFSCDQGDRSDDVLEACRLHFTKQGYTAGIAGQAEVNTRYIGSSTSDRRIRIYRKDLEDETWRAVYGPTMRIELVLKEDHAKAWWVKYAEGGEVLGYSIAAGHIEHIAGQRVSDTPGDIPELVTIAEADAASRLAQNIKQNASWIHAACAAGVDVKQLVDQVVERQGKVAKSRRLRRQREIEAAGANQVQRLAEVIIGGKHDAADIEGMVNTAA